MSECTHEHASITFTEDGTKYHVCKGCSAYLSDNELSLWMRINALLKQLAELWEAVDKYSGFGHHEICQAIPDYNIKCVCGLAELEALITPADTKPGG